MGWEELPLDETGVSEQAGGGASYAKKEQAIFEALGI